MDEKMYGKARRIQVAEMMTVTRMKKQKKKENAILSTPSSLSSELGSVLYFSSRLVAMASSLILAAGYSLSTSHMSFFDSTNRSL